MQWEGWKIIWAVLKVIPLFFLKTKTGRFFLIALLSKAGVSISSEDLTIIFEIIFYLTALLGTTHSNDDVKEAIKELYQKELKKIKDG